MFKDSVVVDRHSHQSQDLLSYISNSILSSVNKHNELAEQKNDDQSKLKKTQTHVVVKELTCKKKAQACGFRCRKQMSYASVHYQTCSCRSGCSWWAEQVGSAVWWKRKQVNILLKPSDTVFLSYSRTGLLTMPVIRARGLVWSLTGLKLSHLDKSLLRVTSVAMSSLAFTE